MEWRKSPEELVRTFDLAVPELPGVERRPMSGYPAAFVKGNMFAGTFQDTIVLRLPTARRTVFLSQRDAKPFEPTPGKPMEEFVVAPPALIADRDTLKRWLHEAMTYVATLAPKSKGGADIKQAKAAAPAPRSATSPAAPAPRPAAKPAVASAPKKVAKPVAAKPVKKAPAKKAPVKKAPAKKAPAKKAGPAKKTAKPAKKKKR